MLNATSFFSNTDSSNRSWTCRGCKQCGHFWCNPRCSLGKVWTGCCIIVSDRWMGYGWRPIKQGLWKSKGPDSSIIIGSPQSNPKARPCGTMSTQNKPTPCQSLIPCCISHVWCCLCCFIESPVIPCQILIPSLFKFPCLLLFTDHPSYLYLLSLCVYYMLRPYIYSLMSSSLLPEQPWRN